MIENNVSRDHATGDIYHNVYTSLIQTHLPKLDDVEAVAYDSDRKTVAPGYNLTVLATLVLITAPIARLLFRDHMGGV
jgi:hypothetical protein